MRLHKLIRSAGTAGVAFALLAPLSSAQEGAPLETQGQLVEGTGQGTITMPTFVKEGSLVAMLMDETGELRALDALVTGCIPTYPGTDDGPLFGFIYGKLVKFEQGVISGQSAKFIQGQWEMQEGDQGTLEAMVLSPSDTEGAHPIGKIEGKFVITDPKSGKGVFKLAGKVSAAGSNASPEGLDAIGPHEFGSVSPFSTPEAPAVDDAAGDLVSATGQGALENAAGDLSSATGQGALDAIGPPDAFNSAGDLSTAEEPPFKVAAGDLVSATDPGALDAIGPPDAFNSTNDFGTPEAPAFNNAAGAMKAAGSLDDPATTGFVGLQYVLME